jgi:hypothetical protein
VNVILLQKTKVRVITLVELLVQPGCAGFLCTNAQQKGAGVTGAGSGIQVA